MGLILGATAPCPVYGIVPRTSHGHAVLAYLVAMVAMLFTAAGYGRMSGAFPSGVSPYTCAQQALNPQVGSLAGWAMILDDLLIPLLSVICSALTASRLLPEVAVHGNVRGIRVMARAGNVVMVLMMVCAALFIAVAARWVMLHHGAAVAPPAIYDPSVFGMRPFMLGAAIASLSYIGFDAVSTSAEDTIRPGRDISVATVPVCVMQTGLCVLAACVATLVSPDFRSFADTGTAILDVSRTAGGPAMMATVTFVLLIAGLASALTGQAGASRLVCGMGRDGVISRRVFAHVDERYSTPTRGVYLMGGFSLIASMVMRFQLAVELLNFGAFVEFILVNLGRDPALFHPPPRKGRRRGVAEPCLSLHRGVGLFLCLNLGWKRGWRGFFGAGALYLAVLTRGFRVAPCALQSLTETN